MATVSEALQAAFDHHQAGRLDEAGVLYARILEVAPDLPDALYLSGMLAAQRGDLAAAGPLLTRAVAQRPGQPGIRVALAQVLDAAGQAAAAAEQFQAVLALPGVAGGEEERTALAALARLSAAAGDMQGAALLFGRWAMAAPDAAAPRLDLARCLQGLGREGEALAACDAALALGGLPPADHTAAMLLRADLLAVGGDAGAAEAAYVAVLAAAPALTAARLGLARLLLQAGEGLEVAADQLTAAIDHDPDALPAYEMLWRLRERQGRRDLAAAVLEAGLRQAPDRADWHYALGCQRQELAEKAAALVAYERALALEPRHTLAHVNRASLLIDAGRMDEAAAALPYLRAVVPGMGERGQSDCHHLARLLADLDAWDDIGRLVAAAAGQWRQRGYFWKTAYYVALETGNYLWRRGRTEGLRALVAAVRAHAPGVEPLLDAWWDFLEGCVALRLGDEQAARRAFYQAGYGHGEHALSVAPQIPLGNDFAVMAAAAQAVRPAYEADLRWLVPAPGAAGEPVVMVAADPAYVRRYLPLLAASIAAVAPTARLHVHVAGDIALDDPCLRAVTVRYPGLRLGCSLETPSPALAGESRIAFLTAVRFLRLPQILAAYDGPLVVADIDGVFLADPAAFTAALTSARPVATTWGPGNLAAPYDAVGGGLVAVRPDPAGMAFVRRVGDFLLHHADLARRGLATLGYFIDQVALVAAVAEEVQADRLAVVRPLARGRVLSLGAGAYVQLLREKEAPDLDDRLAALADSLGTGGAVARGALDAFFQLPEDWRSAL